MNIFQDQFGFIYVNIAGHLMKLTLEQVQELNIEVEKIFNVNQFNRAYGVES